MNSLLSLSIPLHKSNGITSFFSTEKLEGNANILPEREKKQCRYLQVFPSQMSTWKDVKRTDLVHHYCGLARVFPFSDMLKKILRCHKMIAKRFCVSNPNCAEVTRLKFKVCILPGVYNYSLQHNTWFSCHGVPLPGWQHWQTNFTSWFMIFSNPEKENRLWP